MLPSFLFCNGTYCTVRGPLCVTLLQPRGEWANWFHFYNQRTSCVRLLEFQGFFLKRNFCHLSSSGWRLKWWETIQMVDAQLPSTWKGPWRETVCVSQWSYYDWGSGTRPCHSTTLTNSISCADLCRWHPFHPSPRPQSSIEHNRYPYLESPRKYKYTFMPYIAGHWL